MSSKKTRKIKFKIFYPPVDHPQWAAQAARLLAFRDGLAKMTGGHNETTGDDWDAAVVHTGYHPGYPDNQALAEVRAAGKPYIHLGYPVINKENMVVAGWNGGVKASGIYFNGPMPADRWAKYGSRVLPWRKPVKHGHILLCGQVRSDPSVARIDYEKWIADTIKEISAHTDRRIIFRPHPLDKFKPKLAVPVSNKKSLELDLIGCHAVVTYNSASAGLAVLDGIPVFVGELNAWCADVAGKNLADINAPLMIDRSQWCYNFAYTHWTTDELHSGECQAHLSTLNLER